MQHLRGAGADDPVLACLSLGSALRIRCIDRALSSKAATMHLAIIHILLGIVMLTGEIDAIPLRDLEQSGCLEFREYHSSAWERRWLANVDNLQKDACNAMKQDAELGKHWVEQAHLAHECNHLPNNSLWSYFEYANACHEGQHLFIPIEPLVGLLRHPFSHPDCFIEDYSDLHIENRSYVLPMPLSSQLSSRIYPGKRYLIEAGCSNFYNGSLEWFVDAYHQRGFDFDEIWAWEIGAVDPATFWASIPDHVVPKLHFYNSGVDADFKSPANPVNIIRDIAQPGDLIVMKLDIDTEWLEQAIMTALQEHGLLGHIAELMFEQHFSGTREMDRHFGSNIATDLPKVLDNFVSLRQRGLRLHYWP